MRGAARTAAAQAAMHAAAQAGGSSAAAQTDGYARGAAGGSSAAAQADGYACGSPLLRFLHSLALQLLLGPA
ncbi:hypothetical protein [Paenibacillus graminis]|uniref:Uncharacterized protein n=1 Tax=Paenibacillus graminis TaxID=189425 RepID=A0A089MGK8_9BACL|nr:hypothetical protein [Paenibacillus graminis]AIQ71515.1 hypothetical protein PGRAT_30975 [Paenibacillus graminis]